jgi:hypothetical protein
LNHTPEDFVTLWKDADPDIIFASLPYLIGLDSGNAAELQTSYTVKWSAGKAIVQLRSSANCPTSAA